MITRFLTSVNVYVGVVAAIGAAVGGVSLAALPGTPHVYEWTTLSVLALIAGRFGLRLPVTKAWFSMSDSVFPSCPCVNDARDQVNDAVELLRQCGGAQIFLLLSCQSPL